MNTPNSSPAPTRKHLPIGIQTFREIRTEGHYYVDKTSFVLDLIDNGKAYFLSRPRRFGKSLLVDTLKELFEGNRALFTGLIAEPRWDWSQRYPVIRISLGGGVVQNRVELTQALHKQLFDHEAQFDLPARFPDLRSRLADLIQRLHAQTGQRVVALVDEYDKPLLDNIADRALATDIREGLKDVYSVLKDADAHLKFVLLTGVSKFSKVSIFSGLNNLEDITLDPRFSAICGYTDADVDTVFAPELPGLDRDEMRRWYNGYNWLGEGVYNPFDLLLLFRHRRFRNYWIETGTPTFLLKLLTARPCFTPDLGRVVASEALLSTFDVDTMTPEALLFQSGYLSIASARHIPGRLQLTLKYPNQEVQASLNDLLLQQFTDNAIATGNQVVALYDLLTALDWAGLQALFHAFFASIPHQWYTNSPLAQYEGYYASIFYSHFAALGLDIRLEDTTNHGRIDMTVLFAGQVFIFEFKVIELAPEGAALAQIKDRNYADKYRDRGEPIHLIGVEFSRVNRNIAAFAVETLG